MAKAPRPDSAKPSVLIIGGLGYIGRFFAKFIHSNQLASSVRLVDKVLPQLAQLAPEFKEPCASSIFIQADASREASLAKIFDHPDGPDKSWDFVFNLSGETAWSQAIEIYRLRDLQLSTNLGKEAAKRGVKAFVEVSTGMVYYADKKPRKETDSLKPWLNIAKVKLEAEDTLSKIDGLKLVILRLAHVYGEYDSGFMAKPLCLGRVFQEQDRELEWLWTADLKINTVHVEDVARALWTAAKWRSESTNILGLSSGQREATSKGEAGPLPNTPVFNIVDHGKTSQGTLAKVVSEVFNIKTGFHGSLVSQFAKLHMEDVVDELNEEILQPWADILKQKGITKPCPLSPFLEKELLKDRDLSLDGSLFERTTGFEYKHAPDGFDAEEAKKMIASYKRMSWWP